VIAPRCAFALVAALVALQPLGVAQQAAVHVDRERGFEIRPPAVWSTVPQPQPDGSHTTYFLPPGPDGKVLLGVSLRELAEGQGLDHLIGQSLAKVAADPAFSDLERFEAPLDGASRPALRVRFESPAGPLRLEVGYCVEGRRGYVVQRAAPPGEFSAWAADFEQAVASFRVLATVETPAAELQLRELAARCGSQVALASSWEAAASSAREQQRPILVVAWVYGGFNLPVSPETTILCDPDLVGLLGSRFVVWKLDAAARNAFSASYGLSPTTFGQALIVAAPDGEILAESANASDPDSAYAFLMRTLERNAPASPQSGEGAAIDLEAATRLVERGELALASRGLADNETCSAQILLARCARLQARGDAARTALARASELDGDKLHAAAILAERGLVELGLGDNAQARVTCEELVGTYAQSEEAALGHMLLGLLALAASEGEAARAHWTELCASHPESPVAWQAAAYLVNGVIEMDLGPELDLRWPDAAELAEALTPVEYAPTPRRKASAAREGAVEWLLAAQRANGSWPSPGERSRTADSRPSPFVDAVTALAARALLAHQNEARVRGALERAYGFLLASLAARKRFPERVEYMDYTPWSDAAMLDSFAAALKAGIGDERALREGARCLVDDLQARRQAHGGWGYYVTGDLGGEAAPPMAMSFTTAAVVLALAHARTAGLEVGEQVLADASAALASMRDEQGHFVYMQGSGTSADVPPAQVAGAAGRAPLCELALARADASSPARLKQALQVFLDESPSLAAEKGKTLMHCGAQGQGCHYVLFDYAWAATAAGELPRNREVEVRLTELVLDCRQKDGSFLDTPVNGRAYGTAMALIALDALDR
jgi:hypothetical protein